MPLTMPSDAGYFKVPVSGTGAIGTSKTSLVCNVFLQVDWAEGCDVQNFDGRLLNVRLTSLLIGLIAKCHSL